MTKFNVGDKVEFIQNYGSYEIGDVVEVTGIWSNKKGVFFKGNKGNGNAYTQRFKSFTPKKSKNQRITALEKEVAELLPLKEEVAELKLIVHELRDKKVVPSTGKEEKSDESTLSESPFAVGDYVKVVMSEQNNLGAICKITGVGSYCSLHASGAIRYNPYELELLTGENKGKKFAASADQIELTNDIIEFEGDKYRKVDRKAQDGDVVIFRDNTSVCCTNGKKYLVTTNDNGKIAVCGDDSELILVYLGSFNRTPENVDVYELIVEDKPLSPNEQRAQIIEDAKKFIEDCKNFTGLITRRKGYISGKFTKICDAEFVVNPEKRTVVCILKEQIYKTIEAEGIAKCNPSDVFNTWIGMAIALGRALNLDVTKFEQAVQPSEVVVGMKVTVNYCSETRIIMQLKSNGAVEFTNGKFDYLKNIESIINDTNARYGGVE